MYKKYPRNCAGIFCVCNMFFIFVYTNVRLYIIVYTNVSVSIIFILLQQIWAQEFSALK